VFPSNKRNKLKGTYLICSVPAFISLWLKEIILNFSGFVVDNNGTQIPLTEEKGIDILGNMMESSDLSPNRKLYGDLHNSGHIVISYSHDPDHRHLESFGVMGDSATAMRDPVFYRWHSMVNEIFNTYKSTLTPYTVDELSFSGITISAMEIGNENGWPNTLKTHWQQSDINLAKGMDFVPRGDVLARFTHLQHEPFTLRMQIQNSTGTLQHGIVRVFLAPKFDERGQKLSFKDQRMMAIEIDKFQARCEQEK
jgi:tyrosinase